MPLIKFGDARLTTSVALVAVCYTAFYIDHGLDPFDAGLYATEAWRILDGALYGRDFLAPYGPGRYYLIAAFFTIFGTTLKVQAAVFLLCRGLVAALMYRVSRRYLPAAGAIMLAVAITVAHGALHKSFYQAVVLLNVAVYLHYRNDRTKARCFMAGCVVGIGSLFRVDAGLFGACSWVVLLFLEKLWDRNERSWHKCWRHVVAFLSGAALPTLPVALAVWWLGDLEMVVAAEWQRVANLSRFAGALHQPSLVHAWARGSFKEGFLALLILAAPVGLFLLGLRAILIRLRRPWKTSGLDELALVVFGLFALNQLRITPTFNHLLQAVPLGLIGGTLILWRPLAKSAERGQRSGVGASRWRHRLVGGLVAFVAAIPTLTLVLFTLLLTSAESVLPGSIRNRWAFDTAVQGTRAGIYETAPNAAELERVLHHVEVLTRPGDRILTGPYCPVIYFLSDRQPAVRFLEPFYYFQNEELQQRMIAALDASPPALVVLGGPVTSVAGQSLSRDAPLLYHFIRARYRQCTWIPSGRYQIWKRTK